MHWRPILKARHLLGGRDGLVWGTLDWQSKGQGFKSPQLHIDALVTRDDPGDPSPDDLPLC